MKKATTAKKPATTRTRKPANPQIVPVPAEDPEITKLRLENELLKKQSDDAKAKAEAAEKEVKDAKAKAEAAEAEKVKANATSKSKTKIMTESPITWVLLVILLAVGYVVYTDKLPENTATGETVVDAETVRLREELAAERQKAVDAAKADEEAEKQAIRDDIAAIAKESADSTQKLREELLGAFTKSGAASVGNSTPVEQPLPAVEASAPVQAAPVVDERLESFKLQYGTAMLHPEKTPPTTLEWATDSMGQLRVPIFRNPEMNNNWGILTGDKLSGKNTPPTVIQPEPGRVWVHLDRPEVATSVTASDGTVVPLDGAVRDGALVYGTVTSAAPAGVR